MLKQPKLLLLFAIFVLLLFLLSGCAPTAGYVLKVNPVDQNIESKYLAAQILPSQSYVWKSKPAIQIVENSYFIATISPSHCSAKGCKSFFLTVKNKTSKNLELDWNKTLYIADNQTSGGFMFEGVVYKDRNNPKPPDIVFSYGKLTRNIWPNKLAKFFSSTEWAGWQNGAMPLGENGVYLTIIVDGEEVSERLTMNLSRTH